MIVPLKRVFILCMKSEKDSTLAKLSDLGLLHAEESLSPESELYFGAREDASAAQRALAAIDAATSGLKSGKGANLIGISFPPATAESRASNDSVRRANDLATASIALQESIKALDKDIATYEPFGSFDPSKAQELTAKGIPVALFCAKASDVMPEVDGGIIDVLNVTGATAYGVVVGAPLPEGLAPVALPKESLASMKQRRGNAMSELSANCHALAAMVSETADIKACIAKADECAHYAATLEGMRTSGAVSYISGYADARKVPILSETAKASAWGIFVRDPDPEENPPTLLETPRAFRPITTLFSVLGILPGYRETDVSVPFYIFFTIFFAMLIGDAGYALITMVLTALGHRAAKKMAKGRPLSDFARGGFTILYVFAAATFLWGVLSGTYFGIPNSEENPWLPATLAALPTVKWLGDMNNIMQLCFTLGAIHLTIARVWNAIGYLPDTKAISQVGWIGVIWSMYMIICGIVVKGFEQPSWTWTLLGVSVVLIALFMLHKDEIKTDGVSLGMLPLNVISSMGDIISYVRLYAVGLASVKVAENFNIMGCSLDMPLWAKLPCMVLILLLGHLVNYAMGALSILVHAVRLNTLEFSGTKGVSWSGYDFKPFTARNTSSNK